MNEEKTKALKPSLPQQTWTQPVAGEPCSPELGAQTVAWRGREPGAELEAAGTQAGAGTEAQLWRGQSDGNHWVMQEPPNGSVWLSPPPDRDEDQSRRSCRISHPDQTCLEKLAARWVLTSATGTNNLANK